MKNAPSMRARSPARLAAIAPPSPFPPRNRRAGAAFGSRASVEAALEQFFATCARATTRIDPPLSDIQQAQLAQAFNAAGQDLLAQLAAAE